MNQLGVRTEELAADHLVSHGVRIAERNWQCRFGEIDLIAWDGATLVFVEVRSRKSARFGTAAESITRAKQRKLWVTAQCYLKTLRRLPPSRFDAVLFDGNQPPVWLKNILEFA